LRLSIQHARRRTARALGALAVVAAVGAAGCNDFLEGGELTTDPVRPTVATNRQLFVGVQTNIWSILTSDPVRLAGLWSQQFIGGQSQYIAAYEGSISESTTNSFHRGFYAGGGLIDVRDLQNRSREQGDTLFLGIAQIQEAMLMGTAADIFGDLVYTEALKGTPNPPLTPQLQIYDSVQVLLDSAIRNLATFKGAATNVGPGGTDLVYGGDKTQWTQLAYTLKARYYMHTAEVRPAAYALARAAAANGIADPDDDYKAVLSGNAGEENLWYQFTVVQRQGYLIGNPAFLALLESRNDPRRETYFDDEGDFLQGTGEGDTDRVDPGYDQRLVTSQENHLIRAETAYRAGAFGDALAQLQAARADAAAVEGVTLPALPAGLTGPTLLREILTEKYIALFQSLEPWNDYKRTCFPNLPQPGTVKIPARLLYDTAERQTNSSIPGAEAQPTRNANDPANATDPFGAACLGQ
jgi:hypothetical protein